MEVYDACKDQQYDNKFHPYQPSFHQNYLKRGRQSPVASISFYDNEVLDLSKRDTEVENSSRLSQQYKLRVESPNIPTQYDSSVLNLKSNENRSLLLPVLAAAAVNRQSLSTYSSLKRDSSSPLSNASTASQSYLSDSNYQANSLILEQITANNMKDNFYKDFNHSLDLKTSVFDNPIENVPLQTASAIPLIHSKLLTASDGKSTRPFKAYPQDPLVIAANFAAADVLYDGRRVECYTEYRKRILEQIRSANGGQRTMTNPKMRRTNSRNGNNRNSKKGEQSNDGKPQQQIINSNSNSNSESEDRFTESSDNDASSSTPSTTHNSNNNNPMVPNQNGVIKDAAYYERRRKNNAAAKKSRDRRRIKEDEIAIRAAYLERQNIELLCQLDALKAQLANLQKSC